MSGGPDSAALLLLANSARPGKVYAATIDHQLRVEGAEEAVFAAELCESLGVPHAIIPVDVAGGNIQASARAARYSALGDWALNKGLCALMTAHHADDQAETLLMRLNRGSGISGLAGIRESTAVPGVGGRLIRPLLEWRKAELEGLVRDAGIVPVRDPSNEDDRFDRARIRKALAEAEWLDPVQLSASARHLHEVDALIDALADTDWQACVSQTESEVRYVPSIPIRKPIALRIIMRGMQALNGRADTSSAAKLLDALEAGKPANVGGVLARPKGAVWVLQREPKRNAP